MKWIRLPLSIGMIVLSSQSLGGEKADHSKPQGTANVQCTQYDKRLMGLDLHTRLYGMSKSLCSLDGPSHKDMWSRYLKALGCSSRTKLYSDWIKSAELLDMASFRQVMFIEAKAIFGNTRNFGEKRLRLAINEMLASVGGCKNLKKFHVGLVKAYESHFSGAKK